MPAHRGLGSDLDIGNAATHRAHVQVAVTARLDVIEPTCILDRSGSQAGAYGHPADHDVRIHPACCARGSARTLKSRDGGGNRVGVRGEAGRSREHRLRGHARRTRIRVDGRVACRKELAGAGRSTRWRYVAGDLGAISANSGYRPGVRARGAAAAAADPRLAVRIHAYVSKRGVGPRRRVKACVRVQGACPGKRDRVLHKDVAGDIDLTAAAGQGGRGDRGYRACQGLGDSPARDGRAALAELGAERDGEGQGQDHLHLLLMGAIWIVVRGDEAARECIRADIRCRAGAGRNGQGSCPGASRGEKVVGLGDDRVGLGRIAADADRQCGVHRGRISKLLQLVLLPFRRACQEDQCRTRDQGQERESNQDHHLARLFLVECRSHQNSIR